MAAIRNCTSVLKPGGILIEVPNHEAYGFSQRGPVWFHTDAGRHIHFFSGVSLRQALSDAGLAIVETHFWVRAAVHFDRCRDGRLGSAVLKCAGRQLVERAAAP